MNNWGDFHGANLGYVLDLYERYRRSPESVDEATRRYFETWTPPPDGRAAPVGAAAEKVVGLANLAQAIREYGHLAAQLDPLGSPPPGDPALDPAAHGLTAADLDALPAALVGGPVAQTAASAAEAIAALRAIYSAQLGFDFDHLRDAKERRWLREAAETRRYRPPAAPVDGPALLERLTQVETFEHFLHRIFPGKTRFSIEGLDMMVPILDELVGSAADNDTCLVLVGMAHRGRLNVLTHVFAKPYSHILAEFRDPSANYTTLEELGWTGDVKYHKGRWRNVTEGQTVELVLALAPNPSHLEHVNPVVLGMSRAADSDPRKPGPPRLTFNASYAILIHGDASFMAQGIVAETLNLARLPGYTVGGTVHLIANNQLGFTTGTREGRSTLYASDLAKGFKIPILHVNADDVVSCLEAARLACAYRNTFEKDIAIDLIGYRRYGHNEGDEPSFTQPLMYAQIDDHPTVRAQWAAQLVRQDEVESDRPDQLIAQQFAALQAALQAVDERGVPEEALEPELEPPPPGAARRVETQLPAERLRELNEALLALPEGFQLNRKLERPRRRRANMLAELDEATIDWATAEELALASILQDGVPIRITGEDVVRGTFSQRHAALHDVATGETFIPLQALPQARASFEIHNSPLSEAAALGFEYGYNVARPEVLTIWEAQYGDFINAGQAIIDEFLVSGRAKWEQSPSLVLLLPHGHEGQGPDHSTARPERFLQLAAETNLRLAYPTTGAQYFHLLRRQAALLESDPLPLIVLTPKSLLRHPLAASPLRALCEGRWQPVLDDPLVGQQPEPVRRVVLCSGKVYVDLIGAERREESPDVAIVRLEQLYRFPAAEVAEVLAAYPSAADVVWVQEEPQNMGAWDFVRPQIEALLDGRPLEYVGRPRRASPAEGSATWHQVNQRAIVARAFSLESEEHE